MTRDLGNDPRNCRILVVDYETAIIFTGHQCPYELESRKIQTVATDSKGLLTFKKFQEKKPGRNNLITKITKKNFFFIVGQKLKDAGVGARKTIFVGYSMGGLLTKKMLELYPELGQYLKGVIFLATPHFGSPIAEIIDEKQFSYFATFVRKITTPEIIMLGGLEESLKNLNDSFVKFAESKKVPVMSWGEGYQVLMTVIVGG